ncbi:MAG: NAD-dependent epimerase/dehydratase family protein [Prevotellaceae bacterium]|nr:NAD-dependent epimerase/dehydratase family protein [Prevotellaceae bacterium]
MTKISLIGASGFVGTRLIELLKQQDNHTLLNVDKNQSRFYPEITAIADTRDKEKLKSLLQGQDLVVLLAAEHRDDVSPTSLYYDVNVEGTRNVLEAMETCGVKRIIFTSSVAVYGLNKTNPNEAHPADPFNHYGKSKWQAEEVLREWYHRDPQNRNLNILRPTVIFGERNRGNVYNLLKQISSGKFLMVGKGDNVKSMAYVGNVVAFIHFLIREKTAGYQVFNYVDKPDFTTNELVKHVGKVLQKHIPTVHIPYWLGMLGGYCFDVQAFVTRKKLPVSAVRVKKFCATTKFDAQAAHNSGFQAPHSLGEGLARTLKYEFLHPQPDNITFVSE